MLSASLNKTFPSFLPYTFACLSSLLHSERQLRYLFPKIVMEDGGEKFTVDESVLERHASLVMDGIGFAVTCLDDLPKLNKFLVMLGNHHNEYGVPFEVLEVR